MALALANSARFWSLELGSGESKIQAPLRLFGSVITWMTSA
jgi:hypothetical protein